MDCRGPGLFPPPPEFLYVLALRLTSLEFPIDHIKPRKGISNALVQIPIFRGIGLWNREISTRLPDVAKPKPRSKVFDLTIVHKFDLRCCLNVLNMDAVLVRHNLLAARKRLCSLGI